MEQGRRQSKVMKQGPGEESWQVGGMSNGGKGKARETRQWNGMAKGATERVWTGGGGVQWLATGQVTKGRKGK